MACSFEESSPANNASCTLLCPPSASSARTDRNLIGETSSHSRINREIAYSHFHDGFYYTWQDFFFFHQPRDKVCTGRRKFHNSFRRAAMVKINFVNFPRNLERNLQLILDGGLLLKILVFRATKGIQLEINFHALYRKTAEK